RGRLPPPPLWGHVDAEGLHPRQPARPRVLRDVRRTRGGPAGGPRERQVLAAGGGGGGKPPGCSGEFGGASRGGCHGWEARAASSPCERCRTPGRARPLLRREAACGGILRALPARRRPAGAAVDRPLVTERSGSLGLSH